MSHFITRFAPSPTGFLHIGNLRTAVIAWLYTKKNNGKFILRIDDTDLERSKNEFTEQIKKDLISCQILWDDEFKQSERSDIYEGYINFLKENGLIYECFETKEDLDLLRKTASNMKKNFIYDREKSLNLTNEEKEKLKQKNKPYFRFKLNHEKKIIWNDDIKGEIIFDPKQMSDPVVIREDGTYTFLLISVIDDITLNITNIIRGEDHISNTASQIQMFEAFDGFLNYNSKKLMPKFAHLPLLKMPEGKISKRIGGFEIFNLINDGILPISLINYLMSLGSNLKGSANPELSLDNLIKEFNIKSYSSSSPNYNQKDLERLNIKNIKIFSENEIKSFFSKIMKNFNCDNIKFDQLYWNLYKENIESIDDIIFFENLNLFSNNPEKYLNYLKSYTKETKDLINYYDFFKENKNILIIKSLLSVLLKNNKIFEESEQNNEKIFIKLANEILNMSEILDANISKKDIFICLRIFLISKTSGPDMNLFIYFLGFEKLYNLVNFFIKNNNS
jgi:glutamyl-tRNA synthetase